MPQRKTGRRPERWPAPGGAAEAGDLLFDEILEFFGAATNSAKDEQLRGIAERIATAKTALNDQLAKSVAGAKTTGWDSPS